MAGCIHGFYGEVMLTRGAKAVVAGLVGVSVIAMAPSARATGGRCQSYDDRGRCLVWITLPPRNPTHPGPPGAPTPPGGHGHNAGHGSGPVVDGHPCIAVTRKDPQPVKSDPVWGGHKNGAIYTCVYLAIKGVGEVQHTATVNFWAGSTPAAPTPPDPRQLAQEAVAAMNLRAVDMGLVPKPTAGSVGLVGMPNWMWVQRPSASTWGPITKTASARGYTVTATGRVSGVDWDMGDGQSITCQEGTPYEASYGKTKSPSCCHTYTRQGNYTVTATSHWVITWEGIGQAGTIPMDLRRTATVRIGEAQVLTQ